MNTGSIPESERNRPGEGIYVCESKTRSWNGRDDLTLRREGEAVGYLRRFTSLPHVSVWVSDRFCCIQSFSEFWDWKRPGCRVWAEQVEHSKSLYASRQPSGSFSSFFFGVYAPLLGLRSDVWNLTVKDVAALVRETVFHSLFARFQCTSRVALVGRERVSMRPGLEANGQRAHSSNKAVVFATPFGPQAANNCFDTATADYCGTQDTTATRGAPQPSSSNGICVNSSTVFFRRTV